MPSADTGLEVHRTAVSETTGPARARPYDLTCFADPTGHGRSGVSGVPARLSQFGGDGHVDQYKASRSSLSRLAVLSWRCLSGCPSPFKCCTLNAAVAMIIARRRYPDPGAAPLRNDVCQYSEQAAGQNDHPNWVRGVGRHVSEGDERRHRRAARETA